METLKDVGPNLQSFFYHVCKPSDDSLVRGSVVVLHGAEGHGGRYEPFGDELAKQGYAMFAIDHIGHGLTARKLDKDLGKWKKHDFDLSTYNAYYLVDVIKRKYPGKPVYLLGDDYGGTMAQYMLGKYKDAFDGVIISSCGMPSRRDKKIFLQAWFKKVLLYDDNKSKGTFKNRTKFLNFHFKPIRTKYDWLNSVPEEVDKFIEDPLAGYVGTIGYYYYQYKYIVRVPAIMKLKNIRRDIPILLLGGKEDYITGKGKKIQNLKSFYEKRHFSNIQIKLYERSRHDVLLEWNKEEVANDIAQWINENSYNEESVDYKEKKNDSEIKIITLEESKPGVTKKEAFLKEEEPDDDLRLNTEIKK